MKIIWQGRRGSNSQHPVLETGALPIELRPYWYENKLAEWTGLEPATPCVTGRYSNQLNYHSAKMVIGSDLLSHGKLPHYHRRYNISLLSSAWDQVELLHYYCQKILFFKFTYDISRLLSELKK